MSHELRPALQHTAETTRHPRLRIVGDAESRAGTDSIAHREADEAPMVVQFEGLSREQALAALAAFPGGGRFMLAD